MAFGEVFVQSLRCELTPEEHKRKAEALAQGVAELVGLEEHRKAEAQRWKERLEERKRVNNALAYDVCTGSEARPVECFEVPRFADMQVDVLRLDIARGDPRSLVTSRNMLPHERQLEMQALTPEEGVAEPEPAEDETKH